MFLQIEANLTTTTTTVAPESNQVSAAWGYVALVIGGIAFGSASLPIKKCEPGDGVLFQLASALALWSVGLAVQCIRSFPRFYFLPMIGGFFFATANAKMVPILKTIGIGMGTSIRASIGIIVGWADARYGIFGTKPEPPAEPVENYIGVALSVLGALLFLFVRSGANNQAVQPTTEHEPLLSGDSLTRTGYAAIDSDSELVDEGKYFLQSLSDVKKRILGVGLSVTAGICVGLTYMPYLYCIDRYDNASKYGLDYVFSMFTGCLISAFVYFVIYCLAKKNRPYVNARSILPGCINGWVWGVGVSLMQFANSILSQAITFPIACGLQSLVGVLYGVFLFREIRGLRNFIVLACGFVATVVGSALCGISKY